MDATQYQVLTSDVMGRILMDLAIVDHSSTTWIDQHSGPMEYNEGRTYKVGNRSDTRHRFYEEVRIHSEAQREFFESIRVFASAEQILDMEIPAFGINLSPTGLGLHCKESLSVDQIVTVIIPHQGKSYAGRARVVRCERVPNGYGIGVAWLFDSE